MIVETYEGICGECGESTGEFGSMKGVKTRMDQDNWTHGILNTYCPRCNDDNDAEYTVCECPECSYYQKRTVGAPCPQCGAELEAKE